MLKNRITIKKFKGNRKNGKIHNRRDNRITDKI